MARKRSTQGPPSQAEDATQRTETISERQPGPGDTVTALRRLPKGPVYQLDARALDSAPLQWLLVGRDEGCDLVIDKDIKISKSHCYIVFSGDRVMVRDHHSKNRTLVNSVPLVDGHAELYPGAVLTIGATRLVAVGTDEERNPDIVAPDVETFAEQSVELHGNPNRASKAVGWATSSFYRWIQDGKFKVVKR